MLFSKEDLKRLIVPLMLEQFLAITVGMADTMMVSSVGEAAMSGVSLVDAINVLLINLFSALATGGAVLTSQYLGRKELKNAGLAARQLLYTVLAASLLIMTACLFIRIWLLNTLFGHVETAVMNSARVYFLVSVFSYPFLAVYNGAAALFRAMGNSRVSLRTSVMMNLVNFAGNALFIFAFRWGVFGAALATLIARAAGAVVMVRLLIASGEAIALPALRRFAWRWDMTRGILAVGVPTGLENSIFQLGKVLLNRLISTFGTVGIAANAVAVSFSSVQIIPGMAIGLAMVTVVGRCAGAKAFDQARQYTRRLMILTYASVGALNILLLLLTPLLLTLFNLSDASEKLAYTLIVTHGIGSMITWPMSFTLPNALRASNDARFTMVHSVFSMAAFRVGGSYLIAGALGVGVWGVWLAQQVDWLYRCAVFLWRFRSNKWQTKALIKEA